MNWTKQAINIMKKFASGVVGCPWDGKEDTINNAMFYDCCEKIAKDLGKTKIDEEVVREYIFKKHNPLVVRDAQGSNLSVSMMIDTVINCMVLPKKVGDEWICVHGKATLFPIIQEEAKFLETEIQRLLKGLQ